MLAVEKQETREQRKNTNVELSNTDPHPDSCTKDLFLL